MKRVQWNILLLLARNFLLRRISMNYEFHESDEKKKITLIVNVRCAGKLRISA